MSSRSKDSSEAEQRACVHSAFPHHADTAYPVPHVSMHTHETARMNQTRVGPSMMPRRGGGAAATTATGTGTAGETGSSAVTASASSVRPLCPLLDCASTTATSLRVGEMRVRVNSPCTALAIRVGNSHSGPFDSLDDGECTSSRCEIARLKGNGRVGWFVRQGSSTMARCMRTINEREVTNASRAADTESGAGSAAACESGRW